MAQARKIEEIRIRRIKRLDREFEMPVGSKKINEAVGVTVRQGT